MTLTYEEENNILAINYSGTITKDDGLYNMEVIKEKIRKFSSQKGCLKIIFDVRNTIWESKETHDALSAIARKIFNGENMGCKFYAAILNNDLEIPEFGNERWFINEKESITWLMEK